MVMKNKKKSKVLHYSNVHCIHVITEAKSESTFIDHSYFLIMMYLINQWIRERLGVLTFPASCRSCRGVRHWTEARPPPGNLRRGSVEQVETEDLSGERE